MPFGTRFIAGTLAAIKNDNTIHNSHTNPYFDYLDARSKKMESFTLDIGVFNSIDYSRMVLVSSYSFRSFRSEM